jgi:hypothetical protein
MPTEPLIVAPAPLLQPPPPAPAADDRMRKWVAWAIILSALIVTLGILGGIVRYANGMQTDVLTAVFALAGTVIGSWIKEVSTVVGYLFGSSSDSTAKSTAFNQNREAANG